MPSNYGFMLLQVFNLINKSMIQIDDPTILNEIIKNLFKKKRSVPYYMKLEPEYDTISIYWKNNRCTEITNTYVCIDIRLDKDNGMHGIIILNPKRSGKKQYRFTTFAFDITNFRKGEVY